MLKRKLKHFSIGLDHVRGAGALNHRLRRLSLLDRLDEARTFLEQFHKEHNLDRRRFHQRWSGVRKSLIRRGHYDHTSQELAWGSKVAWRNNARCIGRLYWESLTVRDRRHIQGPQEMFDDICEHLTEATGDGRIKSVLTVYPPLTPDERPCYIDSKQIVQYAGYLRRDGTVIGDRSSVDATRIAISLGWSPPSEQGHFDILPIILRDADERKHMFVLPPSLVREIPIKHPTAPELSRLGLRWYAVPLVSDMIMTIGGIDYPCAPFNGFYMGTEIGSRNLADRGRFDLLPVVASSLDLDTSGSDILWKDTALTELNRAVLHSYQAAGVTMIDHHSASDKYVEFYSRESKAGRSVSADWDWIVPPQASSECEVFHLDMNNRKAVPNFYRNRSSDGSGLNPYQTSVSQSGIRRAYERARKRMRLKND